MSARKPSLIRPKDYFILVLPIFLGITAIVTAILSHLNYKTWGEKVPIGGWVTVSLMAATCFFIAFMYVYERWKWVSKWRYTTRYGIQCFFDKGAKLYLLKDVEDATSEMYSRWDAYYEKIGDLLPSHLMLRGTVCLFVAPAVFKQQTPGLKERLVYGLSGWNWMKIGQGGKPIEKTAYIHECSHIYLNNVKDRQISEEESHEIFRSVGV